MAEYAFQEGDEVAWDDYGTTHRSLIVSLGPNGERSRQSMCTVTKDGGWGNAEIGPEDYWNVSTSSLRLIRKRGEGEGPKVGETWEAASPWNASGPVRILEAITAGHYAGHWRGQPTHNSVGIYTREQLARRIKEASPSPPVEASTERPAGECPKCVEAAAHAQRSATISGAQWAKVCELCGRNHRAEPEATVRHATEEGFKKMARHFAGSDVPNGQAEATKKPDPYQPELKTETLPNGKSRKGFVAWTADQNAKHAAMKAQWAKEFNRKVKPRHGSDWEVFSTPGWES